MFYKIVRLILVPFVFILFFPKIINKKNIRFDGKAIVIANHTSNLDVLIMGYVIRRELHWMAKKELFRHKLLGWLFLKCHAFPVKRGEGDLPAIRHAFKILREGHLLCIFPEGTRVKNRTELKRFEPGAALIALKTNTPIVPVYIKGDYRIFRRMKVIVGDHIDLNEYISEKPNQKIVAETSELLRNKLSDLKNFNMLKGI